MTVILAMVEGEERRKSSLIFIKNDSAAFLYSVCQHFQRRWGSSRAVRTALGPNGDFTSVNQSVSGRCGTLWISPVTMWKVHVAAENKGKAGGNKRSWKLFAVNFDVWTVAVNTLNSTRYSNWPCKTCNCAFFEAPKGDFNNNIGWITRINGTINSDAKGLKVRISDQRNQQNSYPNL